MTTSTPDKAAKTGTDAQNTAVLATPEVDSGKRSNNPSKELSNQAGLLLGNEDGQPTKTLHILRRLIPYFDRLGLAIILIFISKGVVALGSVALSEWVRLIIDYLEKRNNQVDAGYTELELWLLGFGIVIVGGLRLGGEFVSNIIASYSQIRGIYNLRQAAFRHALNLPAKWYSSHSMGAIVDTVNNQTGRSVQGVTNYITSMMQHGLTALVAAAYMLYVNALLSIVYFVTIPIMVLIYQLWRSAVRRYASEQVVSSQALTAVASESVGIFKIVKSFVAQNWMDSRFKEAQILQAKSRFKSDLVAFLVPFSTQISAAIAFGVIIVLVVLNIAPLTASTLAAFLTAIVLLMSSLRLLLQNQVEIQNGVIAATRVFHIIDQLEEQQAGDQIKDFSGLVELKNVSFSYPNATKETLSDISMQFKPKTLNVVLGANGSGKSTLVSLLTKLYLPDSGSIHFDGQNITKYAVDSVRQKVPFASQQAGLISGTVFENIVYGLDDATEEQAIEAAKKAEAWDFIRNLKEGLHTYLGTGGQGLSGGQAQRITLARALIRDAPVLILDEATAAVDQETEIKLCETIKKISEERTVITITHRMPIVQYSDIVYVLEEGKLSWSGGPSEVSDPENPLHQFFQLMLQADANRQVQMKSYESFERMDLSLTQPSLESKVLRRWYREPKKGEGVLLFPLYGWAFVQERLNRDLYKWRLRYSVKLPVPVIVVGNITVGGTGKTPLVASLAKHLQKLGYKPGISSRGYKGGGQYPVRVSPDSAPSQTGDEGLLLAQKTGCDVVVDFDRVRAGQMLISECGCDVILCDDGLQHYRLDRDIELALLDGQLNLGNEKLIPLGPLRESKRRLNSVDMVLYKDAFPEKIDGNWPRDIFSVKPIAFEHFTSGERVALDEWHLRHTVHACAGIGNPQSFFSTLRSLGFAVVEHAFPDHYKYSLRDFLFADDAPIIMTEKDAVNCRGLKLHHAWILIAEVEASDSFWTWFDDKLKAIEADSDTAKTPLKRPAKSRLKKVAQYTKVTGKRAQRASKNRKKTDKSAPKTGS